MAYKHLRSFIQKLESAGELIRITAEVDSRFEITEITDRVSKNHGPALLFENVRASEFPVLTNAFGSYRRMAMALEAETIEDKARELSELVDWAFSQMGKIDIASFFPRMKWARLFFPRKTSRAACQEVVDRDPDLSKLPVLTCWPQDGGPFFTLPVVFTRDPETGAQNAGMYRMQVFDNSSTGMHWHHHKDGAHYYQKYRERGEKMPVAVALGGDPAVTYAATAPLPIILLFLGLGNLSKVFFVAMIVFFQFFLEIRDGTVSLSRRYFDSLYTLGGSKLDLLCHVILPAILPRIFSALRLTLGTAFAVLFLAETFATRRGIGWYIMDAWSRIAYDQMYAGILALSIMGLVLFGIMDLLQRRFCRWQS